MTSFDIEIIYHPILPTILDGFEKNYLKLGVFSKIGILIIGVIIFVVLSLFRSIKLKISNKRLGDLFGKVFLALTVVYCSTVEVFYLNIVNSYYHIPDLFKILSAPPKIGEIFGFTLVIWTFGFLAVNSLILVVSAREFIAYPRNGGQGDEELRPFDKGSANETSRNDFEVIE